MLVPHGLLKSINSIFFDAQVLLFRTNTFFAIMIVLRRMKFLVILEGV